MLTRSAVFASQISGCAEAALGSFRSRTTPLRGVVSPEASRCEQFEVEVFCNFLLSHAMLHSKHDQSSWGEICDGCLASLEERFGDLPNDGDLSKVLESRFDAYGGASQRAIAAGKPSDQPISWVRLLKNYLAAAQDGVIRQKPPVVIGGIGGDAQLQIALADVISSVIMPRLYANWQRLFAKHNSLAGVTAEQLSAAMNGQQSGGVLKRLLAWLRTVGD